MMSDGDGGPDGGYCGCGDLVVGGVASGRMGSCGRRGHRGRDYENWFESRRVSGLGGTRALPER